VKIFGPYDVDLDPNIPSFQGALDHRCASCFDFTARYTLQEGPTPFTHVLRVPRAAIGLGKIQYLKKCLEFCLL
jgi:hypothetical protein